MTNAQVINNTLKKKKPPQKTKQTNFKNQTARVCVYFPKAVPRPITALLMRLLVTDFKSTDVWL